jgi:hypothetical protein
VNLQSRLSPWYLIVLWLVLAGVCRLGAPTLAELSGQDHPEAWGLGGMLVTLFVLGVALFFILGMGYLYQSRPVAIPPRMEMTAQPVPQYTSEVEADFQPGMVFVKVGKGVTLTLHLTERQLKIFKQRIRAMQLRLPINGVEGIPSTEMKRIRAEMVHQGLAELVGRDHNIAYLTQEGAAAIMGGSPAGVVKG